MNVQLTSPTATLPLALGQNLAHETSHALPFLQGVWSRARAVGRKSLRPPSPCRGCSAMGEEMEVIERVRDWIYGLSALQKVALPIVSAVPFVFLYLLLVVLFTPDRGDGRVARVLAEIRRRKGRKRQGKGE